MEGEMPGLLEAAEADPQSVPMGVLLGEKVVGYFRLDFTPGAVAAATSVRAAWACAPS